MQMVRIAVVRAIILLSIFTAAPLLKAQTYQGHELVKAELIANTSAVVPRKPFTVGLLLHMAPHWHSYWKFSGDAGLPTEIKWNLPPGWKIGEIQWPIPFKTNDPGDIQTYGYQDEVMLIQEITPPEKIDEATVKLSAEADWLVCEKICIPGSANLALTLPRSTASAAANAELFDRYRKLLPLGSIAPDLTIGQTRRGPNDVTVAVKSNTFASYAFADFYPLPGTRKLWSAIPELRSTVTTSSITVLFESEPPGQLHGLLVLGQSENDPDRVGAYVTIGGGGAGTSGANAPAPLVTSASSESRGLATFLLFGFIGGFILNFMPCVLPVISLKIFGFIQHAGKDRGQILRSGLAFVAGIFAWFIGLAAVLIALKVAGRQITWAAQFTNPYFVLFLGILVLVFALNLFGVFEISLPQKLTSGLMATSDRQDNLGSFSRVFSRPSSPPRAPLLFLGYRALAFAFTQSAFVILISMFFAIAAGMSAPYFCFTSAQPAWLRFLPKPGPLDAAASETIDGFSPARDPSLSPFLRDWRSGAASKVRLGPARFC